MTVDLSDPGEDLVTIVASSPLLSSLSDRAVRRLIAESQLRWLESGEILWRAGDPPESLALVVTGRLRVLDTEEAVVAELSRGEPVGEMALLTDEPRAATVCAARDSQVLVLDRERADQLLSDHPDALRAVTTAVVERMRRTLVRAVPDPPCVSVAVVPLNESVDVDAIVDVFADTMAAGRSTVSVIDADGVRSSGWDPAGPDTARHLSAVEAAHDLALYVAHDVGGEWAERCLRQADVVLLVAGPDLPVDPGPRERKLWRAVQASGTRIELVVCRGGREGRPTSTNRLLVHRPVARHHHVRVGERGDLERVARLVGGGATVVVLSGGGAKGVAHIGVLEAFDELGIPIDAVGGTSIGAVVGAAYALGHEPSSVARELLATEEPWWRSSLVDPTLPLVALAWGRRLARRLRRGFDGEGRPGRRGRDGDGAAEELAEAVEAIEAHARDGHAEVDVSDTWLPLFCVSTNLTDLEAVVHRSGPLWRIVRASVSVPGLFPPIPYGGDLLVDGGLLDNLPIGTARSLHPGARIVAVDVGSRRTLRDRGLSEDGDVAGWRSLFLGRRGNDAPTLPRLLMRLTELGDQRAQLSEADLVIRPELEGVGLLDFGQSSDMRRMGRDAALAALEDWQPDPSDIDRAEVLRLV
ncbi:MAG: patatin-like phospholipase family protein [Actinomycetota bacterium]|nr:patatin-like phospholipase family protein [Actinomycetota bacterium]